MNDNNQLCVKLIHCGNKNIANPLDHAEKSNFYVPMGLFPMANNLKKHGVDVEIINLDLEEGSIEEILDFSSLDAVGLDCHWVNQSLTTLDTAAAIKKIKPEIFVFWGGYTASFFSDEILESYPFIDAIIRGDGEAPIMELCRVLKERKSEISSPFPLEKVRNLRWRDTHNTIISNPFTYAAAAGDLDTLDFGDIRLLRNWKFYRDLCRFWTHFSPINQLPMFFLEVGRGCTYNCSFCGGNAAAQKYISNRTGCVVRSIDSVLETIKKAVSLGFSLIFPTFEFAGSDAWYLKLFRRIKAENLEISFAYGSWGLPSKALVDELSEVFPHAIIEVSPESADLEVRQKNKDSRIFYTNEELEACLDHIAAKPNVKIQLYFSYFLAFDTEETVFTTMEYISKLFLTYSHIAEVLYLNLSTDPASLLFLDPGKYRVDMYVHRFADYIDALKDTYLVKNEESQLNMTLFKPKDMTGEAMNLLARKIELFKRIFSRFSHSASLILNTVPQRNVITDYLRGIDLSQTPVNRFTPAYIRDILLDICQRYNIRGAVLSHTVRKEFREGGKGYVNLNIASDDAKMETISQEEKNRICSNIQKARVSIDADFDI